MPEKLRDMLEQLKQQLAADKKKAAVLGVLSLVLVVLVLRVLFGGSTPAPVKAVPIAPPPLPAVTPDHVLPTMRPIPEAVRTIQSAVSSMSSLARRVGDAGAKADGWDAEDAPVEIDGLSRTLIRDPFNAVDWKLFSPPPPPGGGTPLDLVPRKVRKKGPSFWAKLRIAAAERYRAQAANRAQFEQSLSHLELQSTLTGGRPSAYISGRLVHEGDRIGEFSVVRIQDRSVMMRKGDQLGELVLP